MCLIIQRKPHFELPFEKFKSAIEVNPDGYGLSYPENGRLVTIRDPKKPDPEKLYRFVNEDLLDTNLMIHLRYTTAGATNLRNAHPFPILEKAKDGIDLRMAHNGTLHKWKTAAKGQDSDTRAFVKGYVRPLLKRLAKGMEPEELLSDPFLKEILEDQLTAASVLTFLDSEGNSMICNPTGNGGKQEDKWYYSNTYSFREDHREKKSYPTPATPIGGSTTTTGPSLTSTRSGGYSTATRSTNTIRFSSIYQIKPADFYKMSDNTIKLISENSTASELLIKELLAELDKSNVS